MELWVCQMYLIKNSQFRMQSYSGFSLNNFMYCLNPKSIFVYEVQISDSASAQYGNEPYDAKSLFFSFCSVMRFV